MWRPRGSKLSLNARLGEAIEAKLKERWSPQQIAHHLTVTCPHDASMQLSHETIYRSVVVQVRGSLRMALTAVAGHWEGDLVLGQRQRSQIGTLVERKTRLVLLFELRSGRTAEQVAAALLRRIQGLPAALKRTLAWDQGKELAGHLGFTVQTGVPVYFCDPHSRWQRGSSENTNGPPTAVLPQGHRLECAHASRSRRGRRSTQHPPPQDPWLEDPL
jgi:IS30 family transposase